jgi:hypothetical protein
MDRESGSDNDISTTVLMARIVVRLEALATSIDILNLNRLRNRFKFQQWYVICSNSFYN